MQRLANAAYLEGFPYSGLLSVAPYCVPGGIRVVSTSVDYCGLVSGKSPFRFVPQSKIHSGDESVNKPIR